MAFESFQEFLRMGDHGPYVWSAYAIALTLIVSNVVLALRGQKQVRREIAGLIRRDALREKT